MSEEQIKAFLKVVKADATLEEPFQAAADLDMIQAIAQDAGFAISKSEWMTQELELSDAELEAGTWAAARRVQLVVHWELLQPAQRMESVRMESVNSEPSAELAIDYWNDGIRSLPDVNETGSVTLS